MQEHLIASLQCTPTVSIKYKKRHNGDSNQLDKLQSCCHHNLRDLYVYIDDAWWKLKKYFQWKDIGKCQDGCIIYLKFFSVGCMSGVNKSTQIMKMKQNKKETNAWSVWYRLFSFVDWGWWLNLCSSAVNHIAFFWHADDTCPSIQICKAIDFEH